MDGNGSTRCCVSEYVAPNLIDFLGGSKKKASLATSAGNEIGATGKYLSGIHIG